MSNKIIVLNKKATEHFTNDEIACKCCGGVYTTPESLRHNAMYEEFRVAYKRSITPNSWTRCWNKHVDVYIKDGVPKNQVPKSSKHLSGMATDENWPVDYKGMSSDEKDLFKLWIVDLWIKICRKYKVAGGVGFYTWGFHLDSRDKAYNPRGYDCWGHKERLKLKSV